MTKKELSQLYWLKREISLLQSQLVELRSNPPGITVQGGQGGGGGGDVDKVGRYVAAVADLEKLIQLRMELCTLEYRRLSEYIGTVEDSQMRQILTLRYVRGLHWYQVAMELGGGQTSSGVRMAVERFFASA